MHVHATCMSTDNLHSVTVQRRCPDHRTCPAREVSTYLSDASPSCWTSRNHYGWHISLKRKFTQISRHLIETHKKRLVTVKVVVAVRQHAKQTNKTRKRYEAVVFNNTVDLHKFNELNANQQRRLYYSITGAVDSGFDCALASFLAFFFLIFLIIVSIDKSYLAVTIIRSWLFGFARSS